MNLEKLFEAQKVLRDHIGYNEPDRFNKLILALLVELGECANEWRGFKFWSVNQLPHTSAVRVPVMIDEDKEFYNPLLEEYVDGLHFLLEIGLEINRVPVLTPSIVPNNIIGQFNEIFLKAGNMWCLCYEFGISDDMFDYYDDLFIHFINLGKLLGFTWEQIEQAYFEKNKINHQRQDSGAY